MYFRCLTLAALLLSTVAALETSLVLRQPSGASSNVMGVVNPANGAVMLYNTSGGESRLLSTHNFLQDLELLAAAPVSTREELAEYSRLRIGNNTAPTYPETLQTFFSKESREPGVPSAYDRARQSQEEFWAEIPEYDGVVRAALSIQHLMIVVPSMHVALVYHISNNQLELESWRNIGLDLYMQGGFNTSPNPQELLRSLPPDVREEFSEKLEEKTEEMKGSGDFSIDLATLDPWVEPLPGKRFLVFEPSNKRMLLYSIRGDTLELSSMRNMEVDLLIPANRYRENIDAYREYAKAAQKAGELPYTMRELEALVTVKEVANAAASSQDSNVDAALNTDERELVIDYRDLRKVLMVRPVGARNGIELRSIRDYTIQVGVSKALAEIRQARYGAKMLENAIDFARKRTLKERAMNILKTALSFNPRLYKEAEEDRALVKALSDHPEWQPAIDKAIEATEKLEAEEEARKKLLEEQELDE